MSKFRLSQSTIEKLKYYVYLLIDPRDNKVFYVGKGCGNRINQHLLGTLDNKNKESDKINKIKSIQNQGYEVKTIILRHALTEKEAFEIESSIIDLLGKNKLTNIVMGHHSEDKGIASLSELKIKYEAEDIFPEDDMILININNLYDRNMSDEDIYEATRKYRKIDLKKANKIKLVCSVYKGIIRGVFSVESWNKSDREDGRSFFNGVIAEKSLKDKYKNKSVSKYWKQGSQNPIKYVYR